MSIFDNVIFDEFTLLEGKQAEEYKARKEKEAKRAAREEKKHFTDRNYRKVSSKISADKATEEDMEDSMMRNAGRIMASSKTGRKHIGNIMNAEQNDPKNLPKELKDKAVKSTYAIANANDAIERHDRKMAKRKDVKESAFDEIDMI